MLIISFPGSNGKPQDMNTGKNPALVMSGKNKCNDSEFGITAPDPQPIDTRSDISSGDCNRLAFWQDFAFQRKNFLLCTAYDFVRFLTWRNDH